jgi:hypothetical protein
MEKDDYLHEIHVRMLRVVEDLRVIQRQLNYAAMEAPGDPELMEALSSMTEVESLQNLKSALDQMRHFLWFYLQIMTSDSDAGEKLRQAIKQRPAAETPFSAEASYVEKLKNPTEATILRYLSDAKNRKPN